MGKHRLSHLAALVAVGLAAALVFTGNAIAQPNALGTSDSAAEGANAADGTRTVVRPNACTTPPGCCPIAISAPRTVIPAATPTCGEPPPDVHCWVTAHEPVHVVIRDPESGDSLHSVRAVGEVNCNVAVRISLIVILSKNGQELRRTSGTTTSPQTHYDLRVVAGCVNGTGGQYKTTAQFTTSSQSGRDDSQTVAITCV
jgi:hypothetical protein